MESKSYYEEYWSDEGFKPTGRAGPALQRLFKQTVTPGRWLDVGCGDGRTAGLWLREHGCEYVGVDVSATAVEQARAAGLDARLIEGAGALPFESGEFDGIVCVEALEHIFRPDEAVRDLRRVLRPGGRLVLTVPNVAYWHQRLELFVGRWNPHGDDSSAEQPWRDPHVRFFTAEALTRLLLSSGFSSVRIGGLRGRLLGHVPGLARLRPAEPSAPTRFMQRRRPSLFAMNLSAVAEVAADS